MSTIEQVSSSNERTRLEETQKSKTEKAQQERNEEQKKIREDQLSAKNQIDFTI